MKMTDKSAPPLPLVKWAQRTNLVFLTVCLEDCKEPTIKVDEDKVFFSGVGGTDNKLHEVTLEFFGKLNTENPKFAIRDRSIQIALTKKEDGPYWDRLLKDSTKQHWLKIDFSKWKEEDESDEENAGGGQGGPPGGGGGGGGDLEEMMRSMGGLGGGMGGMGGMPGMGGMGGMGGMPGMPDMASMANMGKMERPSLDDLDAEDDSDDEDLPDLE